MKIISLILLPIIAAGSLGICKQQAVAANKQGGGLFFVPKIKKIKRSNKATVTKKVPTTANVNYDGQYLMHMNVSSNISHSSCFSGQRKITIHNNRTSGEIVPFVGALLGGEIRNGILQLYKIRDGLLDGANYNGSISVPVRVGSTKNGQVRSSWTKKGGGQCVWSASLKRL